MLIKNGLVYLPNGDFTFQDILIEGERIVAMEENLPSTGQEVIDAHRLYVLPGLIDIHLHGCMGVDFSDCYLEDLHKLAAAELAWGVTAFCPASMTLPEEELAESFRTAAQFQATPKEATLLGINMEGPFLAASKLGAQNQDYLTLPDVAMFRRLQEQAQGLIKLVDIAPELDGALDFIKAVKKEVHISLAHTAASYTKAEAAFKAGADHLTHLYNAMTPFTHRHPGIIGAASDNEKVMAELICDGIHNHPSAVRAAFKLFGAERLVLISDSMEACGLPDGEYFLGDQEVTVKGKYARLSGTHTIAGSVANLAECWQWAVIVAGIPMAQALRCATLNPAKSIGMEKDYGSLAVGKYADIILYDNAYHLVKVIKHGCEAYSY